MAASVCPEASPSVAFSIVAPLGPFSLCIQGFQTALGDVQLSMKQWCLDDVTLSLKFSLLIVHPV